MYFHILIPTDGSEQAAKGLDHGLALAATLGSRVTILTVTEPFPLSRAIMGEGSMAPAKTLQSYDQVQRDAAAEILNAAAEMASRQGVTAESRHIADARPAEAILKTAAELECSLICMSSHGRRGLSRMLLGSQTAEVLSHSKIPVLVIR